jgi:hypothetical protein
MLPHQFSVFDVVLNKRGRKWRWSICTAEGRVVMLGAEGSRSAARYKANRALFLMLLSAPYHSYPGSGDRKASSHSGRSPSST